MKPTVEARRPKHLKLKYDVPVLNFAFNFNVRCHSMGGAAAGFLVVNRHPARCFMGDTGSLALGGTLGAVAAAAGGAAMLPLFLTSGVFVVEALSVLVQVGYFKLTRRLKGEGVRVFRMAPLHHHLELGGWGEVRVTVALTAAGGACAALGAAAAGGGRAAAAAVL